MRYYPGATDKDLMRMRRLITYAREFGITAALQKAERDAEKIETPEKCRARATILEGEGYAVLANPFRARLTWLSAQGRV